MTDTDIIASLRDLGCDTRGALERTLDDTAFYTQCLSIFYEDRHFLLLGEALAAGDAHAAFESAHALKGVAGNLGLTPLYQAVSALVEPLRQGRLSDTDALYQAVMAEYAAFGRCLGKA